MKIYLIIMSIIMWVAGITALSWTMDAIDAPVWVSLLAGFAYGWFTTQAVFEVIRNAK